MYSVRESVGSVDLGIFFISGNAGQFVPHMNASTVQGTATGKINIVLSVIVLQFTGSADYTSVVNRSIFFY